MGRTIILFLTLAACGGAAPASGRDPVDVAAQIAAARGGETIRLPAGDYGRLTLPARQFARPVTIDARAARIYAITAIDTAGVTILGGTVAGTGERGYGVHLRRASRVRIQGMTVTGWHRGIVVADSSDVVLSEINLTGLISDGIDIALSRRVRVERSRCRDFNPTPGIYDAAGKRLQDGDHPDCIQAWSRPTAPPVADVQIIDNNIEGRMQGIFFGNHVRNGVDDGGFDRIVIRGNRVVAGFPNGIRIDGARDSEVTGNEVLTLPGATLPNGRAVKAMLSATGERNRVCGNRVQILPPALASKFPQIRPCR